MVALFYRSGRRESPDAIEPPQFLRFICAQRSKARIVTLGALNPKAGRYDFLVTTQKNRRLRAEAISRFDRKCRKLDLRMNQIGRGTGAEWA